MKIFPGFNGEDYSYVTMFRNVRDMIALLVLMPILSTKLQIHEGLIIGITTGLESAGFFILPFIDQVWQIYLVEVCQKLM